MIEFVNAKVAGGELRINKSYDLCFSEKYRINSIPTEIIVGACKVLRAIISVHVATVIHATLISFTAKSNISQRTEAETLIDALCLALFPTIGAEWDIFILRVDTNDERGCQYGEKGKHFYYYI